MVADVDVGEILCFGDVRPASCQVRCYGNIADVFRFVDSLDTAGTEQFSE